MAFDAGAIRGSIELGTGGFVSSVNSVIAKTSAMGASIRSLAAPLAAIAGVGGLGMMMNSARNSIDATAKLSDRLGITTETLAAMSLQADLAGVSGDELTMGLQHMLKVAGEAATAGGAAAKALEAVGISSQMLKGMGGEQLFGAVADGLAGIKDPGQRAAAAMEIFSRSGQRLLPMLMQGAGGIAAAKKEADALGISFSRIEAAKVELANDAMTRMGKIVQGLTQSLTIEVAPIVESIANKLTGMGIAGQAGGLNAFNCVGMVLKGIAKLADYVELVKAGYYGIATAVGGAFTAVLQVIVKLVEGVEWVINKTTGSNLNRASEMQESVDALGEQVDRVYGEMRESWSNFNEGANDKAMTKWFDQVKSDSQGLASQMAEDAKKMSGSLGGFAEKADKTADQVRKAVADIQFDASLAGMGEIDMKVARFGRENPMARYGDLEAVRESLLKIDLAEQAKKAQEELMTPFEKFQEQVSRWDDLVNRGGISQEQRDKLVSRAEKELTQADRNKGQFAGFIQAGSAEAVRYQADLANMAAGKKDVPEKQLAEQKKSNKLLGDMKKAIEGDVVSIGEGLA